MPFLDLAFPLRLPEELSRGVRPAQKARCAGGEPAHVCAGLGGGVLGGTPSPAGHRLSLLQLFFIGGQQPLEHLGQPGDLGVHPVDAAEHGGQQRGVRRGEELRALQRCFQLGDLAAGPGPGELGQRLRTALPGDEVIHDVPAGDPVQVSDDGGQLDRR